MGFDIEWKHRFKMKCPIFHARARDKEVPVNDSEVSRSFLNAVLNTAVDAIVTIDDQGNIEAFNRAAVRLFQYTKEEVGGKNVKMLMPESYAVKHDEYLRNYRETRQAKIIGTGREVVGRRKDGTTFPMELAVSEMNIDGEQKFTGIIRDITERKEAEREIRRHLEMLKRSNEELDAFAYIASHDLKSPLRAISHLAHWIEEDVGEVLPAEAREHLVMLHKRVERMDQLLDSLLDYSRVGREEAAIEKVDVREVVREIEQLIDIPDDFKIECEGEVPVFKTEKVPLELVLRNLISNAIKHRAVDKGCVRVSVRDDGDFYEFKVSDNGPGIDEAYHRSVFDMFRTLKPRDEVEGSGIGLSLVKKTVEGREGKAWVESEIGNGANFYFTWPKETRKKGQLWEGN